MKIRAKREAEELKQKGKAGLHKGEQKLEDLKVWQFISFVMI